MRFDWSFQLFARKMTDVRLLFIALMLGGREGGGREGKGKRKEEDYVLTNVYFYPIPLTGGTSVFQPLGTSDNQCLTGFSGAIFDQGSTVKL